MSFSVALQTGRTACVESIQGFLGAVEAKSEHDLRHESRCHGWTRLDVVVHVIAGWQEMRATTSPSGQWRTWFITAT